MPSHLGPPYVAALRAGTAPAPPVPLERRAAVPAAIGSLLASLGKEMGYDVCGAAADGLECAGAGLGDATRRAVGQLSVVWMQRGTVVAAFEAVDAESLSQGALLKLSDLMATQPNMRMPLYILAPGSCRASVQREANRPTFAVMDARLADTCRFIAFETLQARLAAAGDLVKYLRPTFLADLSEPCVLEPQRPRR